MATIIRKSGTKTVAGSASSVTITFSSDDQEAGIPAAFPASIKGFVCVPSWATSFYVTAISTTVVTVTFGTATGTAGGSLYWTAAGT